MQAIKITVIFLFFSVFFACNSDQKSTAKNDKPNIIIIYADDLGLGDVSAYEMGTLQTPNIDKLAQGGIRFTNGYATSATCTPSRYGLLTGQYPWKNPKAHILPGDAPMLIDTAMVTIADELKRNGYNTAVVGKWHLGLGSGNVDWNKDISETPNDIGFDYSYLMAATNDRVPTVYVKNRNVEGLEADDPLYVSYKENFEGEPTAITNPELMTTMKWHHGHNNSVHNGVPRIGYMKGGKKALWVDEDMADLFVNKAKEYIDDVNPTKTGKPFFMYYALHQPHVPRVPHQRFVGKSGMGPRGDAIIEADWCVGEIIKKLEETGLAENTMIVFSSDNGPVLNDGYYDDAVEKLGDHTPWANLRGGKYSLFDAGTHLPLITYWPGKIKPAVSDALVGQIDLAASLTKIAGGDPSVFEDSKDFSSTFLGESNDSRSNLILEAIGRLAIRDKEFAYIPAYKGGAKIESVNIEIGNDKEPQLYNLTEDPGEENNLAKSNPEKTAEMEKLINSIAGNFYSNNPRKIELK